MDYALRMRKINHLRWVCRGIVVAATGISVWANALQAEATIPSFIISLLPPAFVLGGFELVSRIPIRPSGFWMIRATRPLATIGITGGSAYLSYFHQRTAFSKYTPDLATQRVLPLLIDGIMVIGAVSLMELNGQFEELEARQAGLDARVPRQATVKVPVKATAVVSKKERIALVLAESPDATIKEIADRAQVSYNYAHAIVRQLRPAIEAS